MTAKAKPCFAPIPMRAFGDNRLSERHLRTLGVVASHDRLSANGSGCYAGQERLALEVRCSYQRLSENLTDLVELGYLTRERHPLNGKLRVYRVVYTEADHAFGKATVPQSGKYRRKPTWQTLVPQLGNSEGPMVPRLISEASDIVEEPSVNIFSEAVDLINPAKQQQDGFAVSGKNPAKAAEALEAEPASPTVPTPPAVSPYTVTEAEEYLAAAEEDGALSNTDSGSQEHKLLLMFHQSSYLPQIVRNRAGALLDIIEGRRTPPADQRRYGTQHRS